MAPRKDSEINKDLNDIKESLNSICKDLNDLKNNRNEDKDNVKTLIAKVNDLEHLVKQKNDKIVQLEDRINDLEQYTRRDNLVISGLKIKKSYSRAVRNGNRTLTDRKVQVSLPVYQQNHPQMKKISLQRLKLSIFFMKMELK